MIRIVVVSIDGAFMGGFSDIKVIGCMDTNAPLIEVHLMLFYSLSIIQYLIVLLHNPNIQSH